LPGKAGIFERNRQGIFLGRKGGKNNQTPKGGRTMIKRLALLCCILLVPTIAAAAYQPGQTNYGEWWAGGQVMGVFTLDRSVTVTCPGFAGNINNIKTDAAVGAGAIVGYNFCMANRPIWERYFGVALDFSWNQFNQSFRNSRTVDGNQYALSFLGRLQYPFMGDDTFTRGRVVPFIMAGPAVVWSNSNFSKVGGSSKTSTDVGAVVELGLEYFVVPQLSIGPSFRYRHVFWPTFSDQGIKVDSNLDQFMVLGRLAYHF
jgi:opacity protein-like surface antigen